MRAMVRLCKRARFLRLRPLHIQKLFLLFLLETVIQQLNGRLDLCGLSSDCDESLVASSSAGRSAGSSCTGLHDTNLATTDAPNFVDLGSSFSDDTADKIVRNVYLLRSGRARGRPRRRI